MFIGKQERVFTNVIDNIMNQVYWQTRAELNPMSLIIFLHHVYWQTGAVFTMSLIIL